MKKSWILFLSLTISISSFASVREFKVAVLGDTGAKINFPKVLKLIADEQSNLVLINGDFGYSASASTWKSVLQKNLDTDKYPVIGALGNHDVGFLNTGRYISIFKSLRNKNNGLSVNCTGSFSILPWMGDITAADEVCTFGNVSIVVSAIGQIFRKSYFEHRLENKLKRIPKDHWKLVGYHYTLESMTPGLKPTENTHEFFDLIRRYGAIGAQAHTHSVMASCPISSKFDNKKPVACSPHFTDLNERFVAPGVGLFIDSSLGGQDVRNRSRCLKHTEEGCSHLVDIITREGYSRTDGTTRSDFYIPAGVMFFNFNVGGNPNRAYVYYKSIDGQEIFSFNLTK